MMQFAGRIGYGLQQLASHRPVVSADGIRQTHRYRQARHRTIGVGFGGRTKREDHKATGSEQVTNGMP